MKKKSKLKTFIIVFLVIAALVGAAIFARIYIQRSKTIAVGPVSNYASTGTASATSQYGQITSGGVEEYTLDKTLLLEKVYVSEGDTVTKGQALYKYDNTQSELAVDKARINSEIAQNDLDMAKKRLVYLTGVTTYTHGDYSKVMTISSSGQLSGTGKEDDPYTCTITQNSVIQFGKLITDGTNENYYKFNVVFYDSDYKDVDIGYLLLEPTQQGKTTFKSDYDLSEELSYKIEDSKLLISPSSETSSIFSVYPNGTKDLTKLTDEEKMSKEALAAAIKAQEAKIKELDLANRQANLDYRKAQATQKDGVVTALSNGVVTKVGDKDNLQDGESFIEIQSNTNYQITTSINEFDLDKFHVGDTFEITMWSNNMTYVGTITDISIYPDDSNSNSSNSSMQSYYSVIGELDCEDQLSTWDGGQITFSNDDDNALFCLQAMFVREENGKHYCMVAGNNDRLEKRYVEVGKTTDYGYNIEILSGLSMDDEIAFPYGSNAIVGAKVDRNGEVVEW